MSPQGSVRHQSAPVVARCAIQGEEVGRVDGRERLGGRLVQYSADYAGTERRAQDAKIGIRQGAFMLPSQWRARQR